MVLTSVIRPEWAPDIREINTFHEKGRLVSRNLDIDLNKYSIWPTIRLDDAPAWIKANLNGMKISKSALREAVWPRNGSSSKIEYSKIGQGGGVTFSERKLVEWIYRTLVEQVETTNSQIRSNCG